MECSRTSAQVVPRHLRSNNTNKWNAQEPHALMGIIMLDQIIPINGMLKNLYTLGRSYTSDQIIPINGMLKNTCAIVSDCRSDQIIPINGMLKNLVIVI